MFKRLGNYVIIACLWFAAFASLYSDAMNVIALYVILPFAFLLSVLKNGMTVKVNVYMNILIILYLWAFLACSWAEFSDLAFRDIRQILGTFLVGFILSVNVKDQKLRPWLYGTYIVLFAVAWWYAKNNIMIDFGDDMFRLNDEKLNANTMAYYLFYTTFLVFILGEIVQTDLIRLFWRIVFWTMLPLTFITALLTASRQVFLVQIPLISFLLYVRYLKNVNVKIRLRFVIVILITAFSFAPKMIDEYKNSYLAARSEESVKDDTRTTLFFNAIEIGTEHFPLGVGPGNYLMYSPSRHFSHNTFTELWANLGIIGLWLYCIIMWRFLKKQWKRSKMYKDDMYLLFLLFGLIYVFDGMFYVFYNSVWLMSFFMLVAAHSEVYFRENIDKKEK